MKKVIVIQQDEAYFLYETLRVLEKEQKALKDFHLTVLVSPAALAKIQSLALPDVSGITTDIQSCLNQEYDLSFNLSLGEASWDLHHKIKASNKHGPLRTNGELIVPDLWSTFLLTFKGQAPFLTFHLQDIFRNILGIRGIPHHEKRKGHINTIAFGFTSTSLFPTGEQEKLIHEINQQYPFIQFKEITEMDVLEDLSRVLYIGPPSFESLALCDSGARGIFLSRHFSGFNLLPYDEGNYQITSQGKSFKADDLVFGILQLINNGSIPKSFPFSTYAIDHDNMFGAYMRTMNEGDEAYPVYQAYVVLWNFLLSMYDANLDINRCTPMQVEKTKELQDILAKLSRLHDYALSSIDTIHQEARSSNARAEVIAGHVKNLQEIDSTFATIAQSHTLLRPILDFYRIRKGQNGGDTLREQSESSLLLYSEEGQALRALEELFSTILSKS
jgi:hypothetical protein